MLGAISRARGAWSRLDLTWCLTAAAAVFVSSFVVGDVAAHLPARWQCEAGSDCALAHQGQLGRFFVWDSQWYESVARHGYVWNKLGTVQENTAFWPLWPIVLCVMHHIVSDAESYSVLVFLAVVIIAASSAVAFHTLARAVLERGAARHATLLYLVYPGSHFLLRSYPVGLMNLLCCLALLAILRSNFRRAAFCAGIGSCAGPVALSASATVGLAALVTRGRVLWSRDRPWRQHFAAAATILLVCVTAVSGLMAFMLWLQATLHNPVAFVTAEQSWARPPALAARLAGWLKMELIYPDFQSAAKHLDTLFQLDDLPGSAIRYESHVNSLGLGYALVGAYGAARAGFWVMIQAWLAVAMYVWFIGTVQGPEATLRIIYLAPGCFIGLAYLTRARRALAYGLAALSAMFLIVETALSGAGYWVP